MTNRFEQIYAGDEWGHGSGEGSLLIHNRGYMEFLEGFLAQRRVKTVVDMGCGDWQFSQHVRWGDVSYHGFDVVRSVVERNQREHARDNVRFSLYSGDAAELPAADLLIVKDVLQHLSIRTIQSILPHLRRYRWALVTNCVNPNGPTENTDIEDGGFRYLDPRQPPFNLKATEVYAFSQHGNPIKRLFRGPRWKKRVLLVEQAG